MRELSEFHGVGVKLLFTDIDDTMTDGGLLRGGAYQALWDLNEAGVKVVPITGRPAGWCELIARMWPVDGVVGENGGFYFRYDQKNMKRYFSQTEAEREKNQQRLVGLRREILAEVSGAAVASDQFCRVIDLAIDFCEDVTPLGKVDVDKIVEIFTRAGAQAKVSSIHVNGWFGDHNKLTMCREFVKREYGWDLEDHQQEVAFIGDSPNDEPMFEYFENSFAVANIGNFVDQLTALPKYKTSSQGGLGFSELCRKLIELA